MFDLPVGSASERRAATKFRNWLLDHGFEMSQFRKEQADRRLREISANVPGADAGTGPIV
jgi:CRISPR-associated protein Cas2